MSTASHPGDDLSAAVKQVKDLGRTTGEKMDEVRHGTAGALADAASSIRSTGHQGSEAIHNLAEGTASRLDSTAAYVRTHEIRDMFPKLREVVRRHPASFVAGAAALGFLLGSAGRRK